MPLGGFGGISTTIKSLMNICGTSSQVWGVALGFIDRCCIWSGGELFLQGAAQLSPGQGSVGAAPQTIPASSASPKSLLLLLCGAQSQPRGSGRTTGARSAGALLSELPLEMGFGAGDSLAGPACSQGHSRAAPPTGVRGALPSSGASFLGEGWHWGSGGWILLLQPILWHLAPPVWGEGL